MKTRVKSAKVVVGVLAAAATTMAAGLAPGALAASETCTEVSDSIGNCLYIVCVSEDGRQQRFVPCDPQ